ncbi:ETX/MTX2 family pore-forming toxin [Bacillus thuringiensis]|nr:ETX/MTX2 family pore-forming toxin [Bacillus thuringiensis]
MALFSKKNNDGLEVIREFFQKVPSRLPKVNLRYTSHGVIVSEDDDSTVLPPLPVIPSDPDTPWPQAGEALITESVNLPKYLTYKAIATKSVSAGKNAQHYRGYVMQSAVRGIVWAYPSIPFTAITSYDPSGKQYPMNNWDDWVEFDIAQPSGSVSTGDIIGYISIDTTAIPLTKEDLSLTRKISYKLLDQDKATKNITAHWSKEISYGTSKTQTNTFGITLGIEMGISIPLIAESKVTGELKYEFQTSNTESNETSITKTFDFPSPSSDDDYPYDHYSYGVYQINTHYFHSNTSPLENFTKNVNQGIKDLYKAQGGHNSNLTPESKVETEYEFTTDQNILFAACTPFKSKNSIAYIPTINKEKLWY